MYKEGNLSCGNSHFLLRTVHTVLTLVSENPPVRPSSTGSFSFGSLLRSYPDCASLKNAQGRPTVSVGSTDDLIDWSRYQRFPSPGSPSDGSIVVLLWAPARLPALFLCFQGAGARGPVRAEHGTPLRPQGWTHSPRWASQSQLWRAPLDSSLWHSLPENEADAEERWEMDRVLRASYCLWLQLVFSVTEPSKCPSFLPPFLPSR